MTIDSEIRAFIEDSERFYSADAATRGFGEQRVLYDAYAKAFALARPEGVTIEDAVFEAEGRRLPLRLYRGRPGGASPGTIVYAHGGGTILGSLDSHDGIVARIAARTGGDVIAVDYRLAPEHPYPAAHDDALAVVAAVSRGVSPWPDLRTAPLVLCGDSAGATLMASAALRTEAPLAGLALVYPALGYEPAVPARDTEADAPMLTLAASRFYRTTYLAGAMPEPWAYPLEAASLAGMPPTFIVAAEHDPLRDDGVAFASRLARAGIAAECLIGRGLVHGFLRAIDRSTVAAEAFGRLTGFISERLASR